VLRIPPSEDWRVRVVPNLYPAFAGHEVVIHTPDHLRSIADLEPAQLHLVAEAWRSRAEAAAVGGYPYLHALVNEGRAAGSSLPHTHSQLVWLTGPPPAAAAEGGMDGVLSGEAVLERDGLVLLCPEPSRSPYEMRVAPGGGEASAFASDRLGPALALAAEAIRRLRALQPGAPLNLWLHDGPWWHVHLVPRLTVAAGIELGAGIDINALPAADAAAQLRAV
jgi:UDPglucose--hexose-1-phosphate uridylyltransferase